MLHQPIVAIVILNYNGKNYLERFLPSVISSTYQNKKIIVADNASTDNSVNFLQQNFPSIEILVNTKNDGFAGGYNWALKNITADYYVLLNSDVEVTDNWIEPIINLMEADKTIAACQPKILSYNQPKSFEYAGACGGWIDVLGYPFSRGRIFDVLENDTNQYNTTTKIFWATGAAMFVRPKIFHEMNGFDEQFFAHQEEIDLCWRMQLAGYSVYACPTSIVHHVGAGTLPRGGRKVYLNFRNNLVMLCKNLPLKEKIYKLPLRLFLDGLSAWKGLLTGDAYFFTAIVKAHYALIVWWMRGKIKISQNRKPFYQLNGVYKGCLVWQHFVKNKKSFQEIVDKKHE
ncbi:MAG: glycosyltransferase family 2 protein [Bacteroidetes bacterium]|nr:glycosyltransferase family 2 protein [Bacteroidota bacterium]MBS1670209.1 glycosyltransferase family 2 protein [Bacteroidota bacterium]